MKSIYQEFPWNFECLRSTNGFLGFVLSSALQIKKIYIFFLLQYIVLWVFPNVLEKRGYYRLEGTVGVISQEITTLRQRTSWYEISGSICCSYVHKRDISKTLSAESYEIIINLFALFVVANGLLIWKEDFKLTFFFFFRKRNFERITGSWIK